VSSGYVLVSCTSRDNELNVAKVCHVIGIIGLLAGLAFHVDMAVPYW
jgi:hypothetical protein